LIAPLVVLGFASLFFGGGLSDRFGKTVRVEPVVYQLPQEKPLATLEDFIRVTPTPYEELPLGSGYLDAPFLERFGEPYTVELINYSEATSSAVPLPRTYLVKQTMVYDISLTTRIQGQWPRAVEALKRNILLGSGYSALGAATDGDYFRMLGETGMLGTISFLSIFVLFFLIVARYLKHEKDPFLRSFVIGVSAGLSGLFVNAIFIDIFEASKIAYVMWMTIGVVTALIVLKTNDTFDLYRVTSMVNPPSGCTNSAGQTGWGTWSIQNQQLIGNYPFPANGIIFLEDDIFVDGQINGGRLTIAAAFLPDNPPFRKNIMVNNDLLYTNYDGSDVIGLIAQGNINVGLVSEDDLRIDAALIAQNGRVGRHYYRSPSGGSQRCSPNHIRQTITLWGMIATNQRYGFAYTDGTGYQTRNLNYDGNLLYGPPPSFPLTSDQYVTLTWGEE